MIKKFKWIIMTAIMLSAVTLLTLSTNQRQEQDIFIVIHQGLFFT